MPLFGNAKKFNKYDLISFDYGVGYTSNGDEFYFDKDDYEKIRYICWHKDSSTGYIKGHAVTDNKKVFLHRIVMNAKESETIDHINHNLLDNKKTNLRKCTRSQNSANAKKRVDNKSGCSGVYYQKSRYKWAAQISVNNKKISLGRFDCFDDAVKARKDAENKYYKEFSFDNSIRVITGGDCYGN